MSAQRSDSPQWFGAMVAAYGVRSAENKAEAVHTWAERVKAAISGQHQAQEKRGDREAA